MAFFKKTFWNIFPWFCFINISARNPTARNLWGRVLLHIAFIKLSVVMCFCNNNMENIEMLIQLGRQSIYEIGIQVTQAKSFGLSYINVKQCIIKSSRLQGWHVMKGFHGRRLFGYTHQPVKRFTFHITWSRCFILKYFAFMFICLFENFFPFNK